MYGISTHWVQGQRNMNYISNQFVNSTNYSIIWWSTSFQILQLVHVITSSRHWYGSGCYNCTLLSKRSLGLLIMCEITLFNAFKRVTVLCQLTSYVYIVLWLYNLHASVILTVCCIVHCDQTLCMCKLCGFNNWFGLNIYNIAMKICGEIRWPCMRL